MLTKKIEKGIDFYADKFKDFCLGAADNGTFEPLSTGSLNVDLMLNGGLRPGIVEVFGAEGVGKSTFAMGVAASATKTKEKNKFVLYIDAECGILSFDYLKQLNIDISRLLVIKKNDGDEVFEVIEEVARNPNCGLIIVDSVASLMSKDELTSDGTQVGTHARMIARRIRSLLHVINTSNTCPIIFINQLRANINTANMFASRFGEQFTTTGGKSIKYGANLRLDISLKETITKADRTKIGLKARIKVSKSRYTNTHSECEYNIKFGKGFSEPLEIIDLCLKSNFIEQSGSWYYIQDKDDKKSFNSKWNLLEELENNNSLLKVLKNKCLKQLQ